MSTVKQFSNIQEQVSSLSKQSELTPTTPTTPLKSLITQHFNFGDAPYHIYGTATIIGDDLILAIGGSEGPHIGAVAVGTPCTSWTPGKERTATASIICVQGHMDDTLARQGALQLAAALNTTVTVTTGIHLDDASLEDIKILSNNFNQFIEQVKTWALSLSLYPTKKKLLI
ncbi:hypothetical protein [uncultured Veillonella sp.]|uniref:prenylated flavin chaperone LpdD n=1 Tax=uncultured Veillonella sp. TaxID=159268 RepID=UPI0025E4D4F2|nr:hypothetical protein [uncultured Veillonella sp.]